MRSLEKLAGRYRYVDRCGPKGSPTWKAIDEKTSGQVIAAALPMARAAAVEGIVGLKHAHVTVLLDVVHEPAQGALPKEARSSKYVAVAVAEHVDGLLLQAALKKGALPPERAVACVSAIADAVANLHQSGGAHGAISPRNVVLEPAGDRPGPVLAHFVSNAAGAYCSLERVQGGGPSPSDDVWALYATLYAALIARPPFEGKTRPELADRIVQGPSKRLADIGVDEPSLQAILDRGLDPNPRLRARSLGGLVEALASWAKARAPKAEPPRPKASVPIPPLQDATDDDEETALFHADDVEEVLSGFDRGVVPEDLDDGAEGDLETVVMTSPLEIASGSSDDVPAAEPDVKEVVEPPKSIGKSPFVSRVAASASDDDAAPLPSFEMPPSERSLLSAKPVSAIGVEAAPPSSDWLAFPRPPAVSPASPPREASDAPRASVPSPHGAPLQGAPSSGGSLASAPASAVGPISQPTAPRSNRMLWLIVALLAAAVAVSGAMLWMKRRGASSAPPKPARNPVGLAASEAPGPAAVAPAASAEEADGAPPPKEKPRPKTAAERSACVREFFSEDTFEGSEEFEFLCEDKDFRGSNSLLHRQLVVAGTGKVTPGMREWSTLGWYELGVTAVLRRSCCPADAAPIKLPDSPGPCESMPKLLERLAADRTIAPKAAGKEYAQTLLCYYANGVPRPYEYQNPTGTNRRSFVGFLERNAHLRR